MHLREGSVGIFDMTKWCIRLQQHQVTHGGLAGGLCCNGTGKMERQSNFRCQLGKLMHKCSH